MYPRRSPSIGNCKKSTPFSLGQNKDISLEPDFRFLMRRSIL